MKKQILVLSLFATVGLSADDNVPPKVTVQESTPVPPPVSTPVQPNTSCNTCCCNPCCCKPCCIPLPKKCITCECYVPQYYDLQCAANLFFTVDFLYWYTRETNLSFAAEVTTKKRLSHSSANPVLVLDSIKNLETKWDPGFRIGLGWNIAILGWDLYLHWTYFHNSEVDSTSVDSFHGPIPDIGKNAFINPWVNASFTTFNDLFFNQISTKWKLNLNSIDLELGHKYWLNSTFVMRPYTGMRGAWTKTKFSTLSVRNSSLRDFRYSDSFKNRDWGIGLLAGIQPYWYLVREFCVFGNLEASLIWGKFTGKKHEHYHEIFDKALFTNYHNGFHNHFSMMQAIVDLAIGFRWEATWGCDRLRTALDFGWEHHIWFDHNHRIKTLEYFTSATSSVAGTKTFDEATGNLGFGGLFVSFRIDF